ncbi:U3 snoRNP protein [Coemansia interrupta]|uniref:U3 snoRNP protein n=1 Tax=Coemansia interrupta TaxID=1126814 RepID=A0A9W8LML3_9FUNG|nr:U3 snoRNP protein [Coemansia interrupta]
MAEIVQYQLERMVGELEDLERLGLFSKAELKTVVKKRTKFEYSLRRRHVPASSFLRYIAYEMNMEALRKHRAHRILKHAPRKHTLSSHSITQRIISLYERALVRHGNTAALWEQYIAFVAGQRSGGGEDEQGYARLLAQVYGRAIARHPRCERLWVMAAAHEVERKADGSAARTLLLRALRVNPTSRVLWSECFRLEVLLVERIRARRRVLGIDGAEAEAEAKAEAEAEDEDDGTIRLDALDDAAAGAQEDAIGEHVLAAEFARLTPGTLTPAQHAEQSASRNAFLQGAVVQLVFTQAIRSLPKDLSFRQECAALVRASGLPTVHAHVLATISADFGDSPAAQAYLCTEHMGHGDAAADAQLAVERFAVALGRLGGADMWAEYLRFLGERRADEGAAELRPYYAALAERALARLTADGPMDAGLALQVARELTDRPRQRQWLAEATLRFPQSAALWTLHLQKLIDEHADAAEVEQLFERHALASPDTGLWDLWLQWTERQCAQACLSPAAAQRRFLKALAPRRPDGQATRLQVRYVEWAWALPAHVTLQTSSAEEEEEEGGVAGGPLVMAPGNAAALRRAYANVARHAFPTAGFYARCIELEPDVARRRLLHEMACRVEPADMAPWIAYLRALLDARSLDAAATVLFSARAAMPTDAQRNALDAAYQELTEACT